MGNAGYAGVAQSVEHLHGKEKVVGSIPTPSLFLKLNKAVDIKTGELNKWQRKNFRAANRT